MATLLKHYAHAGERRVHYRRAGDGPPLVMIHASPGSSWSLEPLIARLSERYTVIAPDTPGYGESSPLEAEEPTIGDFAEALAETLDALGVSRCNLFGSHTGTKIALEFAIRYPHRVRRLVLDGVGAYPPETVQWLLDNYTPFFIPVSDGSHLVQQWTMRRDMTLFWPWFNRTPEGRLLRGVPSDEVLHDHFVDMLRAGNHYRKGYRAAFRYDAVAALQKVTVPTALFTRAHDPLRRYLDRVGRLPDTVLNEIVDDGEDGAFAAKIVEFLGGEETLPPPPPPPPVPFLVSEVRRDYALTSVGQVLMRKSGEGPERPLVILHASPGSSLSMEPLLLRFGLDRPVVTFDNPCNGDSAPLPGTPEIGDLADVLLEAIDQLGWPEYDLLGSHTGAMIAIDIAIKRPAQVKHLILDGITLYDPEKTKWLIENYPIPLRLSSYGDHLIWAWNQLRDMQLFYPYFDRTAASARRAGLADPEAMHRSFVEFIKGGKTYHKSYRAAFAYPTRERLPLIQAPTMHCASPTDPLRVFLEEGKRLTPNAVAYVTHPRSTPEGFSHAVSLWRTFLADLPLPEEGRVA
ncbi:MAG: alpha/beta hydrolase [Chloroflexota bacterium]|nr:alpha/beta hydrolase [Dehalococcoidia bacterium]MDW8253457.1 alpha/beta hydrolase [Chloroflexota bacterium]